MNISDKNKLRLLSKQETLFKLKAESKIFGVTRIADITYLDNISIPTWQAIRPEAFTLCVSQGKGLTDEIAIISALMESLEFYCWESFTPTFEWISLDNKNVINPIYFPEFLYSQLNQSSLFPMTLIQDVISGYPFGKLHIRQIT